MSQQDDLLAAENSAFNDTLALAGAPFTWSNNTYQGVIDYLTRVITVAKSSFTNRVFPKCGDAIILNGKKMQITKRGNSELKVVSGGFVEDPAFTDDPADPFLDLTYDHFTRAK